MNEEDFYLTPTRVTRYLEEKYGVDFSVNAKISEPGLITVRVDDYVFCYSLPEYCLDLMFKDLDTLPELVKIRVDRKSAEYAQKARARFGRRKKSIGDL